MKVRNGISLDALGPLDTRDGTCAHTIMVERVGQDGIALCYQQPLQMEAHIICHWHVIKHHVMFIEERAAVKLAPRRDVQPHGRRKAMQSVQDGIRKHQRHIRPSSHCPIARLRSELLESTLHDISLLLLGSQVQQREVVWRDEVIRIRKSDVAPTADFETKVVRCRHAMIPAVLHKSHTRIFCFIRLRNLPAVVCRAILDENDLEITERLCEQTVHARRQIRRHIVHWHDHRDFRPASPFHLMLAHIAFSYSNEKSPIRPADSCPTSFANVEPSSARASLLRSPEHYLLFL